MGTPRRYHRWQASSHRGVAGGFLEGGQVFFVRRGPAPGRSQTCGAGLPAMQATRFLWVNRVDIIAGKPAPTEAWPGDFWRVVGGVFCAVGTRTGQFTDLWELACLRCKRRGFYGYTASILSLASQLPQRGGRGIFGGWSGVVFVRRGPYRADHRPVGAGLPAMQATRFLWVNRVDIIAGKPAPTEGWPEVKYPRQISRLPDLCTDCPGG